MKWRRFATPKTEFVEGDWNVIDDRFGNKVKASSTSQQWDGMRTVAPQPRHPQDFLRAWPERIRTPWARPARDEVFVNAGAVLKNGTFLTDTAWTKSGGSSTSWTIANGFALYTAGSTDTLYQDINAVSGKVYRVTFTVYDWTGAGGLTASIGTASGTTRSSNGTFEEDITSSGTNPSRLTLTPSAGGTSFKLDNVRVLRVG